MTILLRICSSVFLIIGLCALGYADEHFPFLAQVSKKSVNIRAGANANFEKLGQLNQADEILVIGKSYDWYKVQLPSNAKAYVRADYLKARDNSVAEVTGDKVNIRANANSDSASLGMLQQGDLVKIILQTNGWCQIEPPVQAVGWIREDFLAVKVKESKVTPVPVQVQTQTFATIDVKGQLVPLNDPKADMRYQLIVDGKVAYYVQNVPNMDRFKGAMVLIKGLIVSDHNFQYSYPVLRAINISLLL